LEDSVGLATALSPPSFLPGTCPGLYWLGYGVGDVTLKKLECSKQAYALNTLAWNNATGLWPISLVCGTGVMIKRDSRGHSYFIVRGEILGFMKDELLRKHLPRMFSLIKKELSICQSSLCLDLVSFPVLSQIKPQAPRLVVPFRQFL
jgi:hypothetical protein